jgi:hypothetical protein
MHTACDRFEVVGFRRNGDVTGNPGAFNDGEWTLMATPNEGIANRRAGRMSTRKRLARAAGRCLVGGMDNVPLRARRLSALLGCLLSAAVLQAAEPALTISLGGKTTVLETADLAALAHQDVTAFDFHEKKDHVYSGVPVRDLLARAGVEFGEKLRGRALRQIVIVHCRDHYDIVFALAEFDDAFNNRIILLVDRQDGLPLPEGQGPVRLVVPGDKRPARWARMVTSLEVTPVEDSAGR